MVESKQRKSVFLKEATRAASVRGSVTTARLEDLAAETPAPSFDAASLRAVRLTADLGLALTRILKNQAALVYFDSSESALQEVQGFRPPETHEFKELQGFRLSIFRKL